MNLLIDYPPKTVMIGGREYEINSDFRTSILFELMMQDDDVDIASKIIQTIDLYFKEPPMDEDLGDIMKAVIWFYQCGRSDKERKPEKIKKKDGTEETEEPVPEDDYEHQERAYSYDYDDEYIYAAFLSQYGIDLTSVKYLHWWKFRAMFKGLSSDCQFVKIMGYRTTRITKDMSKTEKEYIRKMKRIHALPVSEKEMQEQNALADALINGGDVDSILGFSE